MSYANLHAMALRVNPKGLNYAAECTAPDCGQVTFAGSQTPEIYAQLFASHRAQYEPGRAPDIEVDWEPIATCPVCENGGDIEQGDDGLVCTDCNTCWSIDGSYGERRDA